MEFILFGSLKSAASAAAFRAEVGRATDAAQLLGLLIKALEVEFPNIAKKLSLTDATNEKVDTLTGLFRDIDRETLSRKISSISQVKEKEDQAIDVYQKLREQLTEFTKNTASAERIDPLERKNLIQGLMRNCVEIIDAAFPGISKDIGSKVEIPTHPKPTHP